MEERKLLGIMICVYTDLRDSNIFHPLFTLKAQSKILHIFFNDTFLRVFIKIQKKKKKKKPYKSKMKGGKYHI